MATTTSAPAGAPPLLDPTPIIKKPLTMQEVVKTWLPLAASWAVMALEAPTVSAVMARLADPELHLAAYGAVVLPVSLIVEAPVIMLLAATVALGKDLASYRLIGRFMLGIGLGLTVVHALLAFTPLFDLILVPVFGPPEGVIEPARLGLKIMLPWTFAIGYRRYQQGVLIRFGRSYHVSIGTALRLVAVAVVALVVAFWFGAPGIVAATLGIAVGVSVEAVYSGFAAAPVVRGPLTRAAPTDPPLGTRMFLLFYVPLVATSFLSLLTQPIGSAAMARMPGALTSLAAWPVVNGLLFMVRAFGMALNEVVVALLDRPGAFLVLRKFALLLAGSLLAVSSVLAFTPAARFWFSTVSGLSPELTAVALLGFTWALVWPALDALRNLAQGVAVFTLKTAAVGWSMVLFITVAGALLAAGVVTQRFTALPTAMVAFVMATITQVSWLWHAVRFEIRKLAAS